MLIARLAVTLASANLASATVIAAPTPARQKFEVATFLAPQSDLQEPYPGPGLPAPLSQFKDQTLRQILRISVGGDALKIKFSNAYGTTPVQLNTVRVASSLGSGVTDPESSRVVTFAGKPDVTLAPGAEMFSDEVPLRAKPLSEIAVSIYMKSAPVRTAHRFSNTTAYIGAGDQTAAADLAGAEKSGSTYFMPEIVAIRSTRSDVIVAFGDSITDGGAATREAYRSWPDQLANMAYAVSGTAVVNAGIGGNRWVRSNMGPCGLCRFERDVLDIEGVTHVVLALGVNDIGLGFRYANGFKDPAEVVTAKQITDTLQKAINAAKAKGLKVYAATIVPFKGSPPDYYTTGQPNEVPYGLTQPHNAERMRQEINEFIRNNRTVDGVIDIDRAIADPTDPLRQRADLTKDTLHPNDAGNTLFAQLVYRAIFSAHFR